MISRELLGSYSGCWWRKTMAKNNTCRHKELDDIRDKGVDLDAVFFLEARHADKIPVGSIARSKCRKWRNIVSCTCRAVPAYARTRVLRCMTAYTTPYRVCPLTHAPRRPRCYPDSGTCCTPVLTEGEGGQPRAPPQQRYEAEQDDGGGWWPAVLLSRAVFLRCCLQVQFGTHSFKLEFLTRRYYLSYMLT
jgi:hypothetical protein